MVEDFKPTEANVEDVFRHIFFECNDELESCLLDFAKHTLTEIGRLGCVT